MSFERPSSAFSRNEERVEFPFRLLALGSLGVVTLSYLSVLYDATRVVDAPILPLILVVAASLGLAYYVSRKFEPRRAIGLTVAIIVVGYALYLLSVPDVYLAVLSIGRLVTDLVAMLTGLSILRIVSVEIWALGFVPAPVFLSWYLAFRKRYVSSVMVAGAALAFFVLTDDANLFITLAGSVGAIGVVAFGNLERIGATWDQVDSFVLMLSLILIAPLTLSVVPGGATSPLFDPGAGRTVESTLLSADENIRVAGSISLSPKVRFEIKTEEPLSIAGSETPRYWHVSAYDRYTGGGWVRTGDITKYEGERLPAPPGPSRTVTQTVTAKSKIGTMPAAWKPVSLEGNDGLTRVTDFGDFQPNAQLVNGSSYTVESRVLQWTPDLLRNTPTEYPQKIRNKDSYFDLPASTPDSLGEKTTEIIEKAGADNPYDKAKAIENWLETNKNYSLEVQRPRGDIASSFVSDMDSGYCVYFATAMVAMLRSQDIPARFAVGYTTGQKVSENKYVVRGMDSHAWVEVYFTNVGWVTFDPTPSSSRSSQELQTLQNARQSNESGVDTDETRVLGQSNETTDPGATQGPGESEILGDVNPGETQTPGLNGSLGPGTPNGTNSSAPGGVPSAGGGIPTPSPRQTAVIFLSMVGITAAAHKRGYLDKAYITVWLIWQRKLGSPEKNVEIAYRRLEYYLGSKYRERNSDETVREYLTAINRLEKDDRIDRVFEVYERSKYSQSGISEDEADEIVSIVDSVIREGSVPKPSVDLGSVGGSA